VSRTPDSHELVRSYLSDLDAALRGVPAAQARELKEQITAHLEDALPPEASDEQVTTVLGRLGSPADLAADLGQAGVTPPAALGLTGAWLRRRLAQVRRRTWIVAGVIVALAGIATGYLIFYVAPGPLQFSGTAGWWYQQDATRAVDTTADGASQTTVPIRFGHRQAFAISIYNPTGVTQTILGPAYGPNMPLNGPGSSEGIVQIGVALPYLNVAGSGFGKILGFTLPGAIPPHQARIVRVLWISNVCVGNGGEISTDALGLRVRVGWFIRNEIIPLDQGWGVAGTSRGTCE
jgi:hypothetical protein